MVKGEQVQVISQSALGRALDLSPPAITKLKKQGMPVHSIEAAQAWRMARQSVARRKRDPAAMAQISAPAAPPAAPAGMGEGAYSSMPSYNESRARREAAEARQAELELAIMLGKLVRVEAMKAAIDRQHAGLRELLLQLPSRVVPLLVAAPDPVSMDKLLRSEILGVLEQIVARVE